MERTLGNEKYNILNGKPQGMRLLGRPRQKWEDNFKIYLEGMGCEGVNWMHVA
jgi:hypothetical protein